MRKKKESWEDHRREPRRSTERKQVKKGKRSGEETETREKLKDKRNGEYSRKAEQKEGVPIKRDLKEISPSILPTSTDLMPLSNMLQAPGVAANQLLCSTTATGLLPLHSKNRKAFKDPSNSSAFNGTCSHGSISGHLSRTHTETHTKWYF